MADLIHDSEMLWHNDGHKIFLRIIKSELEVYDISCPHISSANAACYSSRYGCAVKHFIHRFGMDCNVGSCMANEVLDICWSLVGDINDLDESQLWFVPLNDEVFHAWMQTRMGGAN